MGVAQHHNHTVFIAAPGLAGGPGHRHFPPNYGFVPVAAMPVESPGTVAMVTSQIVATSKEGGRPYGQSCR
jgi:hypothetical protein